MVHLLWRCLRDIVVLTVQASEVTACAGNGETGGTRMEMIERFLLHRIDSQSTRLTIDLTHKYAIIIPPTATYTRLALSDVTVMRTKRTLHSTTLQLPIIPTFYHSFAILRNGSDGIGRTRTDTDFVLSDGDKKKLKEIALQSIKDSLDGKSVTVRDSLLKDDPMLSKKCGAFVSLHKHGHLRGCIGHFGEDTPLYEIVAEMARAAAFEDPRFMPVSREELDAIDIEISVLTPMRRIQSLDEFELHRHGIYIRKGYRSGTFLPQVADEVNWTKEEFVGHCSQDKAGLGWNGWKDAELYVYEAIVF